MKKFKVGDRVRRLTSNTCNEKGEVGVVLSIRYTDMEVRYERGNITPYACFDWHELVNCSWDDV